jgi:hypothetical protein
MPICVMIAIARKRSMTAPRWVVKSSNRVTLSWSDSRSRWWAFGRYEGTCGSPLPQSSHRQQWWWGMRGSSQGHPVEISEFISYCEAMGGSPQRLSAALLVDELYWMRLTAAMIIKIIVGL